MSLHKITRIALIFVTLSPDCGLFEQYQTFLSNVLCGAETALTEYWHRQVDCKTLFFCPAWRLE